MSIFVARFEPDPQSVINTERVKQEPTIKTLFFCHITETQKESTCVHYNFLVHFKENISKGKIYIQSQSFRYCLIIIEVVEVVVVENVMFPITNVAEKLQKLYNQPDAHDDPELIE